MIALLDQPRLAVVGRHHDRRPGRDPRRHRRGGPRRGGRGAAGRVRRPGELDVGRASTRRRSREATLGSSGIGPLEWYFDKGPFPAPGAAGAVNNTYYRPSRAYPDPDDPTYKPVGIDGVFAVTNLPSYRLTIDMARPRTGRGSSRRPARAATRSTATTAT